MARRLRSIYGTVGRARMTRTADSIGEWNPPSPSCLLQHGSGCAQSDRCRSAAIRPSASLTALARSCYGV